MNILMTNIHLEYLKIVSFFFVSFFLSFANIFQHKTISLICLFLSFTNNPCRKENTHIYTTMEWIYVHVHEFLLYIYFILIILLLQGVLVYVKQILFI